MKKQTLIFAACCALSSHALFAAVDLRIDNATILNPIDKHQVNIISNHWLTIQDGKIIQVSDSSQKPDAAKVIDAHGQYLIPGLTDSHVHLKTMPGLLNTSPRARQMQAAFLQRQGANYLYYGVTQVIDPSNTATGMTEFTANGPAPDAYFCGAMPVYQGYNAEGLSYSKLHQHKPYFAAQHSDPAHELTPSQAHAHQGDQPLTRMKSDGATCAKLYFEDGFGENSAIPLINQETAKQLVESANSLKLPVMAHANAIDMQQLAVDANINVMAHGLWNWLAPNTAPSESELPTNVKAVLDTIIEKDIAYQATLNVMNALAKVTDNTFTFSSEYRTVLPPSQIAWYQSEPGRWFSREMGQGWGEISNQQKVAKLEQVFSQGQRALYYLYKNGATLLLGSDTPPAPTYVSQPGLSTYQELTMMDQAGVGLVSLLSAATINNAKAFAIDNQYGSIAAGKVANLLLLNSNPLQSVAAYNDIEYVILHGSAIERATFHIDALEKSE
ncbi:amidohydrolase family protein [Pseudoalteromonas piscicida]|uniref:amidohydrolase family protein n=1 Tax=Pseudoalteromonas piscicida TaxID=43662 RepID=UPI0027E45E60|nr:amidohydrolase family protein [Pseudoalteromonas piscicida]WMO13034.1 amidohydrolase family protein [Pseudoalteromonas piscicida]